MSNDPDGWKVICNDCRTPMTPQNSRVCPEMFLCDDCAANHDVLVSVYPELLRPRPVEDLVTRAECIRQIERLMDSHEQRGPEPESKGEKEFRGELKGMELAIKALMILHPARPIN